MLSWIYRFIFSITIFVFAGNAFSLPFKWDLPPGGELEYQKDTGDKVHQVLLSTPKRINNTLRIEEDEKLKGERESFLIRIDATSSSEEAFQYFKELIGSSGEILYACEQRACGSSNYWANTILKERKLYGRDSDQYYLAAKIVDAGTTNWLTVYAVKNGRKQHYVLVSRIKTNGGSEQAGVNGLVVGDQRLSADQLALVKSHLEANPGHQIWLTASISSRQGDSFTELKKTSNAGLNEFKLMFAEKNGLPSNRIETFAAGGLFSSNQELSSEIVYQIYLLAP